METTNKACAAKYIAPTTARARLRTALMLVWLLIMPVTLYYFSPYLPFMGLTEGIVCGSVFVFAGMFLSATVFGRAFCGWLCPSGAVQDFAFMARPGKVDRKVIQWAKFALWVPWVGAWTGLAVSAAGARTDGLKADFFYQLENGISVNRPAAYIIYLSVLTLILTLSLVIGRRGFCHVSCWMAPFMILGQKAGMLIRLPGLHLKGDAGRCTGCGTCSQACPMSLDIGTMVRNARKEIEKGDPVRIAHHDCVLCMRCADSCPASAIHAGFGGRS